MFRVFQDFEEAEQVSNFIHSQAVIDHAEEKKKWAADMQACKEQVTALQVCHRCTAPATMACMKCGKEGHGYMAKQCW